ncbi:DNA alkylation repair protein [Paenibacillus turpanensis]|uniref:DNA alkylation repair protein n=1 Tax=Paenibacillus turpanensis TaxID=2689078 RepID=UPI00140E9669|nr:DNA alkylation repair protein [Paenibacillus turpanensis]
MEPLKNLFDEAYAVKLAGALREAQPSFDPDQFTNGILTEEWDKLELKQRIRHITINMAACLPEGYGDALSVLRQAAPQFEGLQGLVFPDYVEVYGLEQPELSLSVLEWFTRFSTAEFAIRPFILREPKETMRQLEAWAEHENHHVRRLASEGCRPRLPWACALPLFKRDPAPILPILEKLKQDPSEYVRRSVANNLNDISKDHPGLVLDIARSWLGKDPHTDWIIRHACRGLLKKSVPEALELFGFPPSPHLEAAGFEAAPKELLMGEEVLLSFTLHNHAAEPLKVRVEYGIDFVKANGQRSRKIFAWSEKPLPPGEHRMQTKQSFRPITTRKHYPGLHQAVLLVNGQVVAEEEFLVKETTKDKPSNV